MSPSHTATLQQYHLSSRCDVCQRNTLFCHQITAHHVWHHQRTAIQQ